MIQQKETYGAVFVGSSVVLMARVAYADGSAVLPADVESVAYSIEEQDPCGVEPPTAVEGHSNVAIAVESIMTSSLQTDPPWDVDAIGYNFLHEIDVTTAPAFTTAGRSYRVEYVLTPFEGQPIVIRFQIEAI